MDTRQSDVENCNSAQIKQDIDHTRKEMDETIDHLSDRLSPKHLVDEVLDIFRGGGEQVGEKIAATSRRVGSTLVEQVKQHPLPAALMSAGLVWAVVDSVTESSGEGETPSRKTPSSETVSPSYGVATYEINRNSQKEKGIMDKTKDMVHSTQERVSDSTQIAGGKLTETKAEVRERVSDATSAVADKVHAASETISEGARQGWESTQAVGHRVADQAADWSHSAKTSLQKGYEQAGRSIDYGKERFRQGTRNFPLAMVGGFAAAGLIAGLLLPRTRREDTWFGETSDDLYDGAREKGREFLEEGKVAAAESAQAALDTAEEKGLTPKQLMAKAERVAEKAGEAVREEAKKEGVSPGQLKGKAARVGDTAKKAAAC